VESLVDNQAQLEIEIRMVALEAATQTAKAMATAGRSCNGTVAEYVLVTAKAYEGYLKTGDTGISGG
jgi:hypothetical protein